MKVSSIAAALILLIAAGASAQEEAATEKAEKKTCKTEKVTGSLTRRTRICMTESEWHRVAQGTVRGVDNIVRVANQGHAVIMGERGQSGAVAY